MSQARTTIGVAPTLSRAKSVMTRRLIAAVVIVSVFVGGCVVGAMWNAAATLKSNREIAVNPEKHATQVIRQINETLSLSSDQYPQVQKIVDAHFTNTQTIRQAAMPEMLAEFDRFENEIATVLTPAQLDDWARQCEWVRRNCYGAENANVRTP